MDIAKYPVLLFTGPNSRAYINLGIKTMTARFWKQKPPEIGSVLRAQTGRKKETTFAYLKTLNIWNWDGKINGNALEVTGLFRNEIARREGFKNWGQFYAEYKDLNNRCWDDSDRKHYFILFEVIDL